MKKLILVLSFAVIGFTVANAQDISKNPRVKEVAEKKAYRESVNMQQKLGLTNDQREKVYQVELDRAFNTAKWDRKNHSGMTESDRTAFMDKNNAKLDEILTPDQRTQLQSSGSMKHAMMKTKHHGKHVH